MGQLEAYNINETIMSGLMLALFITYLAETLESNTFESFKGYKYSANILTNKVRKVKVVSSIIGTADNACFKSYQVLPLTQRSTIKLTKLIDDFVMWQDQNIVDFKIDENVLMLQRKYNLH